METNEIIAFGIEEYSRYIPGICKNLEYVRHIPDICLTYDTIRILDEPESEQHEKNEQIPFKLFCRPQAAEAAPS